MKTKQLIDVKKFINNAVMYYLSETDHTEEYYRLMKNENFLLEISKAGISNHIVSFYLDAVAAVKDLECEECKCRVFNYECPIVICNSCNTEYYIKSRVSKDICIRCPSLTLSVDKCKIGTKVMENKDEYKTSIVSCHKKVFQGVDGYLNRIDFKTPESS